MRAAAEDRGRGRRDAKGTARGMMVEVMGRDGLAAAGGFPRMSWVEVVREMRWEDIGRCG